MAMCLSLVALALNVYDGTVLSPTLNDTLVQISVAGTNHIYILTAYLSPAVMGVSSGPDAPNPNPDAHPNPLIIIPALRCPSTLPITLTLALTLPLRLNAARRDLATNRLRARRHSAYPDCTQAILITRLNRDPAQLDATDAAMITSLTPNRSSSS